MIPATIMEILIFGYLALNMDNFVENNMLMNIFVVLLILSIILAIEGLATMAFIMSKCVGKDKAKFGVIMQVGMTVCTFITSELFIPLNSTKFCNKYFDLNDGKVIITQNIMMMILFVLCQMSLAAYILLKEEEQEEEDVGEFISVYRCVKKFKN